MENASDYQAPADLSRWRALAIGLGGICIKSHGGSDALAFANAIGVAIDMKVNGFLEKIRDGVARLGAMPLPQDKPQSAVL